MEPLRLTTLAILIPLGSLTPEAASAHPQPVDQVEIEGNHGSDANCVPREVSQQELGKHGTKSHALPQPVFSLTAPANTTQLHQDRDNQTHFCRLDLDLIETN